jgi:hypothetical protein
MTRVTKAVDARRTSCQMGRVSMSLSTGANSAARSPMAAPKIISVRSVRGESVEASKRAESSTPFQPKKFEVLGSRDPGENICQAFRYGSHPNPSFHPPATLGPFPASWSEVICGAADSGLVTSILRTVPRSNPILLSKLPGYEDKTVFSDYYP